MFAKHSSGSLPFFFTFSLFIHHKQIYRCTNLLILVVHRSISSFFPLQCCVSAWFDADPDPNLHFDADPDPDSDWIKTMPFHMWILPQFFLHMLEKIYFCSQQCQLTMFYLFKYRGIDVLVSGGLDSVLKFAG
jgi:hypothetical protein